MKKKPPMKLQPLAQTEHTYMMKTLEEWKFYDLRSGLLWIANGGLQNLTAFEKSHTAYFFRSFCAGEPIYSLCQWDAIPTLLEISPSNFEMYKEFLFNRANIIANFLFNVSIRWTSWAFNLIRSAAFISHRVLNDLASSQKIGNTTPDRLVSNDSEKSIFRNFLYHGCHHQSDYKFVRPLFTLEVKQKQQAQRRNVKRLSSIEQQILHDENSPCSKNFSTGKHQAVLMMGRCALHGIALHNHLTQNEGLNDIYSSIYCFYSEWPNVISDFYCQGLPCTMRRSFELAKHHEGKLDIFHGGKNHQACVSFLMNTLKMQLPNYRRLQDQSCEQHNPHVQRFSVKSSYSRLDTFMLNLTINLDVENRRIMKKYWPKGIQRALREDEIRKHGQAPIWYIRCFGNNTNEIDMLLDQLNETTNDLINIEEIEEIQETSEHNTQ